MQAISIQGEPIRARPAETFLRKRPQVIAVVEDAGQVGAAHQVFVDSGGGMAAFGDRPDYQALAAGHVAGGEDLGHAGRLGVRVGLDIAGPVQLNAELLDQLVALGAGEAHGQQNKVGRVDFFAAWHVSKCRTAIDHFHFNLVGFKGFDMTVVVADEPLGGDREDTLAAFFVGLAGAEDIGILRPGVPVGTGFGRPGHDLKLVNAAAAVPVNGAQAVGPGVATTNDDDVLAFRPVQVVIGHGIAGDAAILVGQEVHGIFNAAQVAPGDRQVTRLGGSTTQADGVELGQNGFGRDVIADIDAGLEDDTFGFHLCQAAVDVVLFHLEVGNAVAKQAADAVGPLKNGDFVAGSAQLLGGGQPSGATANHGDLLAGEHLGRLGLNPAFGPGAFNGGGFNGFDGHGVVVNPQNARVFARGRAELAGELGEVIGGVEPLYGCLPLVAEDEVVPVGDQVTQGAALVAEGNAAIHAAGALRAKRFDRQGVINFKVVVESVENITPFGGLAWQFHESGWLAHFVQFSRRYVYMIL